MKRYIKLIAISLVVLVNFTSCETYKKNYDQDFSIIYPICGEWVVTITDNAASTSVKAVVYTYDTADKDADKVWLWINNSTYGTKAKLNCNVAEKSFSGKDIPNKLLGGTSSVNNGKVVIDGATTPSNGKSDYIEFEYYSSLTNHSYTVKGFRRTGWPEDE